MTIKSYTNEEMVAVAATISRAYLQQLFDMLTMEESQEVDGVEMIFKEELLDDFREEVQSHELRLAPPKLDDILTRVQDPLEEVNLSTPRNSRISYISNLLKLELKQKIIYFYGHKGLEETLIGYQLLSLSVFIFGERSKSVSCYDLALAIDAAVPPPSSATSTQPNGFSISLIDGVASFSLCSFQLVQQASRAWSEIRVRWCEERSISSSHDFSVTIDGSNGGGPATGRRGPKRQNHLLLA
ncbi:hypothetical protein JCGZ_22888 [Jatropha curcas]|uniref:Uncharacterized protein n=1 Tax=Jatropha curcas TaxID=180498 RepID=A0A067JSS5_JATCU|nr:hypothetical protein JCGZ_22888 [Jatropha curcas]